MTRLRHRLQACTAAALAAMLTRPLPAEAKAPPGPSKVIFIFAPGADGSYPGGSRPTGGLITDSQGRLYGVTASGGQFNDGVVFRLTRPASGGSGQWTEEVLHSFGSSASGLISPNGLLLLGPSGELYGVTDSISPSGGGTVYRLDNVPGWPMTVLHVFAAYGLGGSPDGQYPNGGLQFGPGGLLYGTTEFGGHPESDDSDGTIFSVSPQGDAVEYAVLHRFGANSATDGVHPITELLPAGPNRFYSTTLSGGSYQFGTVFSFILDSANHWVEKSIWSFGGTLPNGFTTPGGGPLTSGPGGVLYGCASGYQVGTPSGTGMFSLTPPASPDGPWSETDLFHIRSQSEYGCYNVAREPFGPLLEEDEGGHKFGQGGIFQILPPASGSGPWTQSLRYSFYANAAPGPYPTGGLLRLGGYYFGETSYGYASGNYSDGTVFVFKP